VICAENPDIWQCPEVKSRKINKGPGNPEFRVAARPSEIQHLTSDCADLLLSNRKNERYLSRASGFLFPRRPPFVSRGTWISTALGTNIQEPDFRLLTGQDSSCRLNLALALLGFTSQCEILDVWLENRFPFLNWKPPAPALPAGLEITGSGSWTQNQRCKLKSLLLIIT
jgi:hypothetical protein